MQKPDVEAEINARFAAARDVVATTLAGQQRLLAGQFLETELRAHGCVRAIPDRVAVRILGPGFARGVVAFPVGARRIAVQSDGGGAGADIEALADRVASIGASPVLIANIGDLETLPPDGGTDVVDTGGDFEPPPPPPPPPTEPEPPASGVIEPAIPFDQLPQELRDQAQAEWDLRVGPEAQIAIDVAMATIQGGGGGGISISDLSGQITALAVGAAAAIGGPAGVALAGLAWILIPRMLAQFESWLVDYALEHGGI